MDDNVLLIAVLRALGSAWRAQRLYPATSPMAVQTAGAVCAAVEEYVQAEPSLKLDVVRGGFVLRGLEGVLAPPGIPELADTLGSHGVGEMHFVAPPQPEEILALLAAAQLRPHELHDRGGMQAALNAAGVGSIHIVAVALNKIETPPEIPEEEADKFLAELVADSDRLAVWLRSLLSSDDEGLSEGLLTLASAAVDLPTFGRTMAASFRELDTGDKDRLLEASIELEAVRQIAVEMLASLSAVELTAAIRGGRYGSNLSALSFALTGLPVGDRAEELVRETAAALRAADALDPQIRFLEQMCGLRRSGVPERPLVETRPVLGPLQQATQLGEQYTGAMRTSIEARATLDADGVETLIRLLDTADQFHAYCGLLDALARTVPHLLETGDGADLGMAVVSEISKRSFSSEKPWPDLDSRFAEATDVTCGVRSMAALVALSAADDRAVERAKELVTLGGETAGRNLASAALASETEGAMEFAQRVLGRRLAELLAPEAPHSDERNAGKLAELYAGNGGPRCMQALGQLAARPEDRVRSETARGIGAAGGQAISTQMPRLIRDASQSVARVAARSLARNGSPEAISVLATRLGEFESDKELPVAHEIIDALAASPLPSAENALRQVAERRHVLRRNRSPEMTRLAREALASREGREAG